MKHVSSLRRVAWDPRVSWADAGGVFAAYVDTFRCIVVVSVVSQHDGQRTVSRYGSQRVSMLGQR